MLKRRSAGFALVELMVVIVILGGLIAFVGRHVNRPSTRYEVASVIQIHFFDVAIDNYRIRKLSDTEDDICWPETEE